MISQYKPGRYFCSNSGWYICMRSGDEQHQIHYGFCLVEYTIVDGQPIAGPFRSKKAAVSWFEGFVSFYGRSRSACNAYISDGIVLPDRNSV